MANKRFRRPAKPPKTRDAMELAARFRERALGRKNVTDAVRELGTLGWTSQPTRERAKVKAKRRERLDPYDECPLGLTENELTLLLTKGELEGFYQWMIGQTAALCDGRSFNYGLSKYEPTVCADNPHGPVYYRWDVTRYLEGRPVDD